MNEDNLFTENDPSVDILPIHDTEEDSSLDLVNNEISSETASVDTHPLDSSSNRSLKKGGNEEESEEIKEESESESELESESESEFDSEITTEVQYISVLDDDTIHAIHNINIGVGLLLIFIGTIGMIWLIDFVVKKLNTYTG